MKETEYLKLIQPDEYDEYNIQDFNDNADIIDSYIFVLATVFKQLIDKNVIEEAFEKVFNQDDAVTPNALTSEEIHEAIATEWNGESSEDENALSSDEIYAAINSEWNGETSEDVHALSAEEIADILKI